MAEYIDRNAFKNNLMTAMINKTADGDAFAMKLGMLMCDLADCEPAADVAPVVHGEWIHNPKREYDYICSVCRGDAPEDRMRNNAILTPYCPHCGAKMDGGKK